MSSWRADKRANKRVDAHTARFIIHSARFDKAKVKFQQTQRRCALCFRCCCCCCYCCFYSKFLLCAIFCYFSCFNCEQTFSANEGLNNGDMQMCICIVYMVYVCVCCMYIYGICICMYVMLVHTYVNASGWWRKTWQEPDQPQLCANKRAFRCCCKRLTKAKLHMTATHTHTHVCTSIYIYIYIQRLTYNIKCQWERNDDMSARMAQQQQNQQAKTIKNRQQLALNRKICK